MLTAKYLLSNFHPFIAGQATPRIALQWSNYGAVSNRCFGLWCAWICSRIANNYFCPIMMRLVSDCCFAELKTQVLKYTLAEEDSAANVGLVVVEGALVVDD
jgi:hypothetical protein